jgi:hypothetical protein
VNGLSRDRLAVSVPIIHNQSHNRSNVLIKHKSKAEKSDDLQYNNRGERIPQTFIKDSKAIEVPKGVKAMESPSLAPSPIQRQPNQVGQPNVSQQRDEQTTKNNHQDPYEFTIENKNTGPPQPAVSNHEASGWVDPFASNSHLPPQQGEPHQDFFGGFSQPQPQPNSAVKQFWEEDTPPKAPSTSENHYLPSQPVQHPVVHPQLHTHPQPQQSSQQSQPSLHPPPTALPHAMTPPPSILILPVYNPNASMHSDKRVSEGAGLGKGIEGNSGLGGQVNESRNAGKGTSVRSNADASRQEPRAVFNIDDFDMAEPSEGDGMDDGGFDPDAGRLGDSHPPKQGFGDDSIAEKIMAATQPHVTQTQNYQQPQSQISSAAQVPHSKPPNAEYIEPVQPKQPTIVPQTQHYASPQVPINVTNQVPPPTIPQQPVTQRLEHNEDKIIGSPDHFDPKEFGLTGGFGPETDRRTISNKMEESLEFNPPEQQYANPFHQHGGNTIEDLLNGPGGVGALAETPTSHINQLRNSDASSGPVTIGQGPGAFFSNRPSASHPNLGSPQQPPYGGPAASIPNSGYQQPQKQTYAGNQPYQTNPTFRPAVGTQQVYQQPVQPTYAPKPLMSTFATQTPPLTAPPGPTQPILTSSRLPSHLFNEPHPSSLPLSTQLQRSQDRVQLLQSKIDVLHTTLQHYGNQGNLVQEIAKVKKELEEKTKEAAEVEEREKRLEKELHEVQQQNLRMIKECQEKDIEHEESRQKFADLMKKYTGLIKKHEENEIRESELRRELHEYHTRLVNLTQKQESPAASQVQEESVQLQAQKALVASLENKISELLSTNVDLKTQLLESQVSLSLIQSSNSLDTTTLSSLMSRETELTEKNKELNETNFTLKSKIDDLEDSVRTLGRWEREGKLVREVLLIPGEAGEEALRCLKGLVSEIDRSVSGSQEVRGLGLEHFWERARENSLINRIKMDVNVMKLAIEGKPTFRSSNISNEGRNIFKLQALSFANESPDKLNPNPMSFAASPKPDSPRSEAQEDKLRGFRQSLPTRLAPSVPTKLDMEQDILKKPQFIATYSDIMEPIIPEKVQSRHDIDKVSEEMQSLPYEPENIKVRSATSFGKTSQVEQVIVPAITNKLDPKADLVSSVESISKKSDQQPISSGRAALQLATMSFGPTAPTVIVNPPSDSAAGPTQISKISGDMIPKTTIDTPLIPAPPSFMNYSAPKPSSRLTTPQTSAPLKDYLSALRELVKENQLMEFKQAIISPIGCFDGIQYRSLLNPVAVDFTLSVNGGTVVSIDKHFGNRLGFGNQDRAFFLPKQVTLDVEYENGLPGMPNENGSAVDTQTLGHSHKIERKWLVPITSLSYIRFKKVTPQECRELYQRPELKTLSMTVYNSRPKSTIGRIGLSRNVHVSNHGNGGG